MSRKSSHIKPSDGEKAEAHQLFQLTAANNGKLPISMYVELDLDFLGIVAPKVGVLITQEPNEPLDTCHKTRLPVMVGWNLIKLAYEVFIQKYGVLPHLANERHRVCIPLGEIPLFLSLECFKEFKYLHGVLCLENFDHPTGVSPLLFSQLCVFHHCKAGGFQLDSVTLNTNGQQQLSKTSRMPGSIVLRLCRSSLWGVNQLLLQSEGGVNWQSYLVELKI